VLIVVRHGRTEANASGRLLGRLDVALDEEGRRQARALAAQVNGASRVVCSPLLRARQTADELGLPVTIDERWLELDYGVLDGQPMAEVPTDLWRHWQSDISYVPEGGESLAGLGIRVRAACADLAEEAAAEDIVVVTHVSPIKAAAAWALGISDEIAWRMYVAPASITTIGFGARGPMLRSFNETQHLTARLT
jgi:broad specificity phosphatase PhoE